MFALFDRPLDEPSQFVGFAGNRIDRLSEIRKENALDIALSDPTARIMLTRAGRLHLKSDGARFDPYFTVSEAAAFLPDREETILLGQSEFGPVLFAASGVDAEALPASMKSIDFRSIHSQALLDSDALGELAQGAALLAWHVSSRFCGRCGGATVPRIGGYKRVCTQCNGEQFPRTDPVAIMLAVTREQCLLGRSPHFAPGMYSSLAGFIEPGETIENAVRRETFEEAGIRIGRVAYHASQPWPFPHSLMIGCFGEALNDDITPDSTELEDCRWFSRAEVASMIAKTHEGGLIVPPPGAIAHHLIKAWVEAG